MSTLGLFADGGGGSEIGLFLLFDADVLFILMEVVLQGMIAINISFYIFRDFITSDASFIIENA